MFTRDFTGFCGKESFGMNAGKNFRQEWSKMTDEEKLAFMNKRMEMPDMFNEDGSVDNKKVISAIDARCEDWIKKTTEEKESLIKQRFEMMHSRGGFGGRGRGFGFGF